MTDTSEIQAARSALNSMTQLRRGLTAAEIILNGLTNAEQVGRELDAAIAKKREELEALKTATIDGAAVEGARRRDALVEEGRTEAQRVVAAARSEAERIDVVIDTKEAELAALEKKIADLKRSAAALAE